MPAIKSELFQQHARQWTAAMGSPAEVDPLQSAICRGKLQILRDVGSGDVPATVASFAELHDYVDANGYGDAFDWPVMPNEVEDGAYGDAFTSFWNCVQNQLDAWIQAGQMRSALAAETDGNR